MKIDKIRTLPFQLFFQHIYLSFILTVYSLYDMKSEMLPRKECVYASVRRGLFPELNEAGISSVAAM